MSEFTPAKIKKIAAEVLNSPPKTTMKFQSPEPHYLRSPSIPITAKKSSESYNSKSPKKLNFK
jgi:hypothetical protein